jgi:D-alanine-D-alanine ligase-like ATP-grasp enzyme
MQRVYAGQEYRVFVLDDEVVYCAQKTPPFVTGDGNATIRQLIAAEMSTLDRHGISPGTAGVDDRSLDRVLPYGERRSIPGRMNRSAGGSMSFAAPANEIVAFAMAQQAAKALGLRAGAVDLFTDIDGDAAALRVIEVNANPSIRFLEDSGREDLILRIWRHTFTAIGLLDV